MPSPKKPRKPYPTTVRPPAECSPIARWYGQIMVSQQKVIRLLGGLPMPRAMIEEHMVPVADRLFTYVMPEGMISDALVLGVPLVNGTMAQIAVRKLLAQGAVIMQGPDGEMCIKLPDGQIIPPAADPDQDPIPASSKN